MPSDAPERDGRRRAAPATGRGRPAPRRRVSMRSAIWDRSLNRARPSDAAARVVHDDRVAARGQDVGDVGPVDPRMAAADAVFAAAADDDLRFVCRGHVGPAFSGGMCGAAVRRAPPSCGIPPGKSSRIPSCASPSAPITPASHLKDTIKALLERLRVPYEDVGTASTASVDYPDFAAAVAGRRRSPGGPTAASWSAAPASAWPSPPTRFPASAPRVVWNEATRALGRAAQRREHPGPRRAHDSSRATSSASCARFSPPPFEGGRHERRLDKIAQLERKDT